MKTMATIKAFTDLQQSKKLAEFLPLESADGFWDYHDRWYSEGDEWEGYEDYPRAEPYLEYTRMENEWKEDKSDVPCWSLASLLDFLPNNQGRYTKSLYWFDDAWHCVYMDEDGADKLGTSADTALDACYKMILKSHELKML